MLPACAQTVQNRNVASCDDSMALAYVGVLNCLSIRTIIIIETCKVVTYCSH